MIEPLEPTRVAELAAEAIEAGVAGDRARVLDALQVILVQAGRLDALAFVLACVYMIHCGLVPGTGVSLGPVRVHPGGAVDASPSALHQSGAALFADMLEHYLTGEYVAIRSLWWEAADEDAAGAVGVAVAAAAAMVRLRRAVLN